ncbi:hypothetical protein [Pseudomonas aeruginosa]|uniref:hypothetical protein n=1 Tax=Pseudomonas aeruginosa TaxID=287 RepID=UPI001BC9ED5D|nr:hypothetical protein [Pseudomonas aeruginosa]
MSKFKPGDLALIVACKLPELVGRAVELVKLVPAGTQDECGGRPWKNLSDISAWIVTADDLLVLTKSGNVVRDQFTLIAENRLMPLRGDFQPEQQKAKEVEA